MYQGLEMTHEGFYPQPLKSLWKPALISPSGNCTPPLQHLSIHKKIYLVGLEAFGSQTLVLIHPSPHLTTLCRAISSIGFYNILGWRTCAFDDLFAC